MTPAQPNLSFGDKVIRRFLLPLLVIGVCTGGAFLLSKLRPAAAREKPPPQVPLVQVVDSHTETLPAQIEATGIVEPAKELTLSPEVTGRVTYVSPNLVTGGKVKQGETLIRIDGSAYALQARQQKSQVRRATLRR